MQEQLRYPIGKFAIPDVLDYAEIENLIKDISEFPKNLKQAVLIVGDKRIDQPYRPEGWTVRQLVHHCADSHINAYSRFKLALTENTPTIKPYEEAEWAKLTDSKLPVSVSLQLLEALHLRWTELLKSLTLEELNKEFVHPEHGRAMSLKVAIAMYSWHCRHHLAHVVELIKKEGWK